MIPELGQFALILALVLAGAQAFFGIFGAARGDAALAGGGAGRRWPGSSCWSAPPIGVLVHAFVNFDFSVLYVASNSNSALPTFYRVAALWGAHEGSLLLWAWILAAWTLAVAMFEPQPAREFRQPRHGRARLRELRIPAVHRSPPRIRSSACFRCPQTAAT